ncbi:MAG: glycosyltransferase [Fibrobacter sp.]|uniref:glycosyltransferase n=1 Tax=Fibrobacter sp. TaxID=35828 RepID=UPI002A912B60|nr:glycosyltransferase [Fibrobacter sp.]MDY6263814.1 glycosyltransferase [Fibrobacter sp.]
MRVLVAPLDWGLGHATRCVPVVREFLNQGAEVELAVVRANAGLLRGIFPELRQRLVPSYNIVYPKHGYNMGLWLVKNGAHLRTVMNYEHRIAEEMVMRFHYDVLVSDNRFGFYSRNAKSIYMTHQRRIAFPRVLSAFEPLGMLWHASVMKRFDEVWVPDLPEFPGYAGALSHVAKAPVPVKYVGALSRFSGMDAEAPASLNGRGPYCFVAVVSGVEPARTRFENLLRETLVKIPGRHAIILGKPSLGVKSSNERNLDLFTHLPDDQFASVVRSAQWVISRGGYSTVMDMAVLGARCVFVPTPGQYEQVILGRDLAREGFAATIEESKFSTESLLATIGEKACVALPKPGENNLLKDAVKELMSFSTEGRESSAGSRRYAPG